MENEREVSGEDNGAAVMPRQRGRSRETNQGADLLSVIGGLSFPLDARCVIMACGLKPTRWLQRNGACPRGAATDSGEWRLGWN